MADIFFSNYLSTILIRSNKVIKNSVIVQTSTVIIIFNIVTAISIYQITAENTNWFYVGLFLTAKITNTYWQIKFSILEKELNFVKFYFYRLIAIGITTVIIISIVTSTAEPATLYFRELIISVILACFAFQIQLPRKCDEKQISVKRLLTENARLTIFRGSEILYSKYPIILTTFIYLQEKETAVTFQAMYIIQLVISITSPINEKIAYAVFSQNKFNNSKTLIGINIIQSTVIFIIFTWYSEEFTQVILGGQWTEVGKMLPYLVILPMAQPFANLFKSKLLSQRKENLLTGFNISCVILSVMAHLIITDILISICLPTIFYIMAMAVFGKRIIDA